MPKKHQKNSQKKPDPEYPTSIKKHILEHALEMAAETDWYDLSISDVAVRSGLTLNEVRAIYPDTDAMATAWFENALNTMLETPPKDFDLIPVRERMEILLLRWFNALTPYKEATISMLRSKFHLPHFQYWVPLVFSLSQHVQLWRDATGLRSHGQRRRIEEIGLTAVFLATFAVWCQDTSAGQEQTRKYLQERLKQGDRFMTCFSRRLSQDISNK